ncbi:MAG TPA: GFA family protein [Methylophilus sp.]
MDYEGSCHCGDVRFSVAGELTQLMACNCSICSRKGALMWFVPRANLLLLTPESDLASYTFGKHVIQHRFCPNCGIHVYGEASNPQGERMAAINVRCLSALDWSSLPVKHYDGRSV